MCLSLLLRSLLYTGFPETLKKTKKQHDCLFLNAESYNNCNDLNEAKLSSLCVLQKVCVLQYSSDSVQKPVGPNYDVQKHDAVILPEVLPGCVALRVVV